MSNFILNKSKEDQVSVLNIKKKHINSFDNYEQRMDILIKLKKATYNEKKFKKLNFRNSNLNLKTDSNLCKCRL